MCSGTLPKDHTIRHAHHAGNSDRYYTDLNNTPPEYIISQIIIKVIKNTCILNSVMIK
ncbi:MAG: hypothetical protein IKA99_03855 [Clostridia bacterium]|nr:hypothetical protein [Clostridia bacterium]